MATTLASLNALVLRQTDTKAESFASGEVDSYLNLELAELWDLVVSTFEDYAISTATRTISSIDSSLGVAYFSVPDDFAKARRVEKREGGRWTMLDRVPLEKGDDEYGYRVLDRTIQVVPYARGVGSYKLFYVPIFTPIAEGGNLPAGIDYNAWHAFAVAGACARVMRKLELDPSAYLLEKQQQQHRVLNAAGTRDAGPVARAVDSRGAFADPYCPYPWRPFYP